MGRKKLKYRDVVSKLGGGPPQQKHRKKFDKPNRRPRKTNKDENNITNIKRKQTSKKFPASKRKKFDKPAESVLEERPISDSESEEEEVLEPIQQLRATFSKGKTIKQSQAIDSESDDSDEEVLSVKTDLDDNASDVVDNNTEDASDSDTNSISDNNDLNEDESSTIDDSNDPFTNHLSFELHSSLVESLENPRISMNNSNLVWPKLGNLVIQIPKCDDIEENTNDLVNSSIKYASEGQIPVKYDSIMNISKLFVKPQIAPNIKPANTCCNGTSNVLTPFQAELFSVINNYQDLYFPERTFDNANEIRFVYCLHAVNHILKTRLKIIHHNAKLSKKDDDVPADFQDQGLVRPKVLIVVPFKDSAYKIVNTIIDIMFKEDNGNVIKRNRFAQDYTGNEMCFPKKNPKPDDYVKTFCGNTSDDFRIGITVTKKSLKLYADFYASDIIIASPLGLRTIIGAEGEPDRDYDFLASIELLIFDQTDIFLMQNWDSVLHIMNHIHLKPQDLHGTDVSRVRQWSLNFWAKYYRQTLIFSSLVLPEINSVFNKKCMNYAGKVRVCNPIDFGSISRVFVQLPHVFHRFEAGSALEGAEERFKFFVNRILGQQKDVLMRATMVFVPSYYDYVKVRNYFKKEDLSFVQICEYSKEGKIARARDMFYHGDAHFLLYSERYHFFNRIRLKGIRHLIFYQLPNVPHLYSEICNLMQESNMNRKVGSMSNMTVTVIYSKYDVLQLAGLVGTERAAKMSQSDRKVHMMMTGSE